MNNSITSHFIWNETAGKKSNTKYLFGFLQWLGRWLVGYAYASKHTVMLCAFLLLTLGHIWTVHLKHIAGINKKNGFVWVIVSKCHVVRLLSLLLTMQICTNWQICNFLFYRFLFTSNPFRIGGSFHHYILQNAHTHTFVCHYSDTLNSMCPMTFASFKRSNRLIQFDIANDL